MTLFVMSVPPSRQNIDRTTKAADSNQEHLKVEASRLAEYNKRACNFWIWIMIIFVCFMFISE